MNYFTFLRQTEDSDELIESFQELVVKKFNLRDFTLFYNHPEQGKRTLLDTVVSSHTAPTDNIYDKMESNQNLSLNRDIQEISVHIKEHQLLFHYHSRMHSESGQKKAVDELRKLLETTLILYLYHDQRRSIEKLQLEQRYFQELTREFNLEIDFHRIVNLLINTLLGQLLITRIAFFYRRKDKLQLISERGFSRDEIKILNMGVKRISFKDPLILASLNHQVHDNPDLQKIGVALVIPLKTSRKLEGIVCLGHKIDHSNYTETDFLLIKTIIDITHQTLKRSLMFESVLERQRIEDELQLARSIQSHLLPSSLPAIAGYEIEARNIQCHQVGGDFYTFLPLDDNQFLFCVGDVSGKGIPAAILMSNIISAIFTLVHSGVRELIELVQQLNYNIYNNTQPDQFITLFAGILDTNYHVIRYVNAGHNYPLLFRRAQEMESLVSTGIILGVLKDYPFEEVLIQIERGNLLLLYSDGVSEVTDLGGREFGDNKLPELIKKNARKPGKTIIKLLLNALRRYNGQNSFQDDITLMIIKRL